MLELTIDEYAKLISDLKAYEVGFTICISLLCALLAGLIVCLLFSYEKTTKL